MRSTSRVPRRRTAAVLAALAALTLLAAACSSSDSSSSSDTTLSSATTASSGGQAGPYVVFNGEDNNLDAYTPDPPFTTQRVIESHANSPTGTDINGQLCFFPDGSNRFVAGEDTNQDQGRPQGWAITQLSGDSVGNFSTTQVGRLVPTFQPSVSNPENYGCGFLSDGRIVTTDVGNQAEGNGDGQLIMWFPPFDSETVSYCKIDVAIATAGSIWVDDQDNIYVASARPPTAGVWRYSGPFPTSADAAGGCGRTDATGAPLITQDPQKEIFIAAGDNGLSTPEGLAVGPDGHLFVSSVFTGVINEYQADGTFIRTVLQPPAGESLGESGFSTGTPLGIGVGPDGTLFYADIGLVVEPGKLPGPGDYTGTLRRIVFQDGQPQPPETMATGLNFPDGIGIFIPGATSTQNKT